MMTPLSLIAIRSLLNQAIHIDIFNALDSTNDYLLSQKHHKEAACLAEHQTKGKGRLGRTWYSPHGENIYLSYRCYLQKPMGEIGGLSMQVGEVVCEVMNQFGIYAGLTVKWPNDVLFEGKKLAGILIEVQPGESGTSNVVIGIGLNVNMLKAEDNQISQPWTSMQAITGNYLDRNKIVATLLNTLRVKIALL